MQAGIKQEFNFISPVLINGRLLSSWTSKDLVNFIRDNSIVFLTNSLVDTTSTKIRNVFLPTELRIVNDTSMEVIFKLTMDDQYDLDYKDKHALYINGNYFESNSKKLSDGIISPVIYSVDTYVGCEQNLNSNVAETNSALYNIKLDGASKVVIIEIPFTSEKNKIYSLNITNIQLNYYTYQLNDTLSVNLKAEPSEWVGIITPSGSSFPLMREEVSSWLLPIYNGKQNASLQYYSASNLQEYQAWNNKIASTAGLRQEKTTFDGKTLYRFYDSTFSTVYNTDEPYLTFEYSNGVWKKESVFDRGIVCNGCYKRGADGCPFCDYSRHRIVATEEIVSEYIFTNLTAAHKITLNLNNGKESISQQIRKQQTNKENYLQTFFTLPNNQQLENFKSILISNTQNIYGSFVTVNDSSKLDQKCERLIITNQDFYQPNGFCEKDFGSCNGQYNIRKLDWKNMYASSFMENNQQVLKINWMPSILLSVQIPLDKFKFQQPYLSPVKAWLNRNGLYTGDLYFVLENTGEAFSNVIVSVECDNIIPLNKPFSFEAVSVAPKKQVTFVYSAVVYNDTFSDNFKCIFKGKEQNSKPLWDTMHKDFLFEFREPLFSGKFMNACLVLSNFPEIETRNGVTESTSLSLNRLLNITKISSGDAGATIFGIYIKNKGFSLCKTNTYLNCEIKETKQKFQKNRQDSIKALSSLEIFFTLYQIDNVFLSCDLNIQYTDENALCQKELRDAFISNMTVKRDSVPSFEENNYETPVSLSLPVTISITVAIIVLTIVITLQRCCVLCIRHTDSINLEDVLEKIKEIKDSKQAKP
ncbi:hypothetical protein ABK040_009528 [Willaertia magna]